jgi:hypothetical protein
MSLYIYIPKTGKRLPGKKMFCNMFWFFFRLILWVGGFQVTTIGLTAWLAAFKPSDRSENRELLAVCRALGVYFTLRVIGDFIRQTTGVRLTNYQIKIKDMPKPSPREKKCRRPACCGQAGYLRSVRTFGS